VMSLRPRNAPAREEVRSTRPARAPLEVEIETLVLHGLGLGPAQAERVRAALVAELSARLLLGDASGLLALAAGGPPPTVRLRAGDAPEVIAGAIAGGLVGSGPAEGGQR